MSELNSFVIYTDDDKPLGVVSQNSILKADTVNVPDYLKKIIIEIEDKRFYNHIGIDAKSVIRALFCNIRFRSIKQGGSTLTQQLARNLIENNDKTFYRKAKEALIALDIERKYSKEEILQLYFDNIYFGKNIRGIRSASLCYFNQEPELLSKPKLLFLITILRGPNYYLKNLEETKRRYRFLNKFLFDKTIISELEFKRNCKFKIKTLKNSLDIIRPNIIPFINANIDLTTKTISSTLDKNTHLFTKEFVKNSKYPVSIVAIRRQKVIAFASSYGSDYPFMARSNVGSTLKPFLYCFFRENGLSQDLKFRSKENNCDWPVREANYNINNEITLPEALILSNNNAFINATDFTGLDKTLNFLGSILNIDYESQMISNLLGSTKKGITLYELAILYSKYFQSDYNQYKDECLEILQRNFRLKTGLNIENIFLKTGTTNDNKERYALIGDDDIIYAILRNENPIDDTSKEGGFLNYITSNIKKMFNKNTNYKWT